MSKKNDEGNFKDKRKKEKRRQSFVFYAVFMVGKNGIANSQF